MIRKKNKIELRIEKIRGKKEVEKLKKNLWNM
jgi:hypothetical protein